MLQKLHLASRCLLVNSLTRSKKHVIVLSRSICFIIYPRMSATLCDRCTGCLVPASHRDSWFFSLFSPFVTLVLKKQKTSYFIHMITV